MTFRLQTCPFLLQTQWTNWNANLEQQSKFKMKIILFNKSEKKTNDGRNLQRQIYLSRTMAANFQSPSISAASSSSLILSVMILISLSMRVSSLCRGVAMLGSSKMFGRLGLDLVRKMLERGGLLGWPKN